MTRRDFIKSMLAAGAVAVAGRLIASPDEIPWMAEFIQTGKLHGQHIVLHQTFVIDTDLDVSITNCHFSAAKPLRRLVHVKRAPHMVMAECIFVGATDSAILLDNGPMQHIAASIWNPTQNGLRWFT